MKKGRIKVDWKKFLISLLLLIFIIIILLKFAELRQIALLLKKVRYEWLFLALVFQFAVFALFATFFKVILKGKYFWHLFKIPIAIIFVDHTLPLFSASGNLLLYHVAKKEAKEKASLLVALNVFLNFLFYFIMFIVGLIYLLATKKIIAFEWFWFSVALVIIVFILLTRILWTATGQRHFKAVMKWLLKKWPRAKNITLKKISELYAAKKKLRKKSLFFAFFIFFLIYLLRIAVIGSVFLALENTINLGVLVVGYIITAFVSTVSYIRIGIYELTMAGTYTALGINYNLTVAAVMLYRLVSFWLSMLAGFFCFRNLMKNKK